MAQNMYDGMDGLLGFQWDEEKNLLNQRKHGVSFEEARIVFYDPQHLVLDDLSHSKVEKRFFCYGKATQGILTVRFTLRDNRIIRIIGAAYWRQGKGIYEKENGC